MKPFLRENRDFVFQLILAILDVFLVIMSFIAAYYLRYRGPAIRGPGFSAYEKSVLVFIPLWVPIFIYFGLYRIRKAWRYSEVIFNTALAVTLGMVIYLAVYYMLMELFMSGLLLLFLWGVNIALVSGVRIIFKLILLANRKGGLGIRRILVVGNTFSSKMLTKVIDLHPELGHRIVGYITPEGNGNSNEGHFLWEKKLLEPLV